MARNYTVRTRILRPVADVFDAIISRETLCHYFTDKASGDLVPGEVIRWHWDHYGELPIRVDEVVANERIVLTLNSREWDKTSSDAYDVRVVFNFEPLDDGNTMLSISEAGWKTDADGLKASHENCSGWTHMAACLKSWIEHGIDLR